MKVTSQDIRNLAEVLPILQKNMRLNTCAVSNLCDCINMAIADFKNRLIYEDLDEDEETEEEVYEQDFGDDLKQNFSEIERAFDSFKERVKSFADHVYGDDEEEETENDD